VTPEGLLLKEVAPGASVESVQKATEPALKVSADFHAYAI
jgi:acyl CoA:acetate/3-ketoacid CoA transferase beta subunit